eukprot:Gb_33433 [translate_table: standard]
MSEHYCKCNGRVAVLVGGDVLALLIFAAIGRLSHGMPVLDWETFHTADPFIAGWLLGAYFLGGYESEGLGVNGVVKAVFVATKSWAVGIPISVAAKNVPVQQQAIAANGHCLGPNVRTAALTNSSKLDVGGLSLRLQRPFWISPPVAVEGTTSKCSASLVPLNEDSYCTKGDVPDPMEPGGACCGGIEEGATCTSGSPCGSMVWVSMGPIYGFMPSRKCSVWLGHVGEDVSSMKLLLGLMHGGATTSLASLGEAIVDFSLLVPSVVFDVCSLVPTPKGAGNVSVTTTMASSSVV